MLTFRGRGGGKSFRSRKFGDDTMSIDMARSLRLPHIGAKEQERAKRCWMEEAYPGRKVKLRGVGVAHVSEHRPKPIMCQLSKCDA